MESTLFRFIAVDALGQTGALRKYTKTRLQVGALLIQRGKERRERGTLIVAGRYLRWLAA